MPLEISQYSTNEESYQVLEVQWEVYNDEPSDNFWELYKRVSKEEFCLRSLEKYTEADSISLKLVDTDTSEVVGGTSWAIYTEPHDIFTEMISMIRTRPKMWPAMKKKTEVSTQWGEGSDIQSMAHQLTLQDLSARLKHSNGPHLSVTVAVVRLAYREEGEAMFMKWAVDLADEKDLECFRFSGDIDLPLFESFGFRVVDEFVTDPQTKNPSEEWIKLKEKIFPKPWHTSVMWRPKKSAVEKGQTEYKLADGSLDVEAEIEGRGAA